MTCPRNRFFPDDMALGILVPPMLFPFVRLPLFLFLFAFVISFPPAALRFRFRLWALLFEPRFRAFFVLDVLGAVVGVATDDVDVVIVVDVVIKDEEIVIGGDG